LEAALDQDVPVLGICRGMQMLDVACGADLLQHVPEVVGHNGHNETPGAFSDHPVAIAEGSWLAGALGSGGKVKSHHHHGPGDARADLVATAVAPDGTVEAIDHSGARFAFGVLRPRRRAPRCACSAASSDVCRGAPHPA
jgi:putative glutamine amidotransferase